MTSPTMPSSHYKGCRSYRVRSTLHAVDRDRDVDRDKGTDDDVHNALPGDGLLRRGDRHRHGDRPRGGVHHRRDVAG